MSQSVKVHKVVIRNREPGQISKGANTTVLIDGIPIPYVSFIKLEIKAGNVAKLTMDMYVDIENVEIDTPLELTHVSSIEKIKTWVLGHYHTVIRHPKV